MNINSNILKVHNDFQNIFAYIIQVFTICKHLFGILSMLHYSFKN